MRTQFYLKFKLLLVGIVASTLVVNAAEFPKNSPAYLNGKLSIKGTQMVNECSNPVQLRGMSTHGVAWFENCYNESSISALVNDWGIELFRIALYVSEYGGYTTNQVKSQEEWHNWIDRMVDICEKYGIYCMIDWHVLNDGSGNFNGDPMINIDAAKKFWSYMSKKHADKKHVLYEICNEPNGNSVNWNRVREYANIIIPIIRQNDPSTIIVVGTPTWSQDVDIASQNKLNYNNIMYALPLYSGTTHPWLRDKAEKAINNGAAIFVSEFGTSNADGSGGFFENETNN